MTVQRSVHTIPIDNSRKLCLVVLLVQTRRNGPTKFCTLPIFEVTCAFFGVTLSMDFNLCVNINRRQLKRVQSMRLKDTKKLPLLSLYLLNFHVVNANGSCVRHERSM